MIAAVLLSLVVMVLFLGPALLVALRLPRPLLVTHDIVDPYVEDGPYRRNVIRVIDGARSHITMVRGEIPFSVYNQDVARALRSARQRGVDITLACGPKVVVPPGDHHPILELAEEGILRLYYPVKDQGPHFVEADSRLLYLEGLHAEGARERPAWLYENSLFVADERRLSVLAAIRRGDLASVASARERHQLLTKEQWNRQEAEASSQPPDPELAG